MADDKREVVVADVKIPFWSMVVLMVKWAVAALVSAIISAPSAKERLRVLIEDWKFRLPMASAILAILYPSEFTIYDVRVCRSLQGRFDDVQSKSNFTTLWERYQDFLKAVQTGTPAGWSLRDKDRHLWGKSFVEQLRNDIGSNFNRSGREHTKS